MKMIETMRQLAIADRRGGRGPRTPAELHALFGHTMPVVSAAPAEPAESGTAGIAFAAGFATGVTVGTVLGAVGGTPLG